MLLNFDTNELKKAITDFYYATGINIILVDKDCKHLVSLPFRQSFCAYLQDSGGCAEKCLNSDNKLIEKCAKFRKTVNHICHAGLIDTAVPIISNNEIIAYIIIGQMRTDSDFDDIYKNISDLGLSRDLLKEKYESLPYCNKEKINSFVNIAVMLTEYILFKNLLKPKYDTVFESAITYINENISKNISINDICIATNTSKNLLYKIFKENTNHTINDYINKIKIEKACELLTNTEKNISQVAEAVGIFNYTYFCKLFKKIIGVTPKKFKKPQ